MNISEVTPIDRGHVVVRRRVTQLTVQGVAVKSLRRTPPCPDPCEGPDTALRRMTVPAAIEVGIGQQGRLDTFEKYPVVRCGPGRRAPRRQPLHHVRKNGRPVAGLLSTHGEPGCQRQLSHPQVLRQKTVLALHVVPMRDGRKLGPVAR